jgi:tetraacyldisaccharide 4'-kinase
MNVLGTIYGAAVRTKNSLFDRGTLHARELRGPVVSVGSISVGGAGKTPFVLLLGELLKARGVKFDVISRGYRRASRGVALVAPDGSARDFGDEPILIARRLEVPVIVAEKRYDGGIFAEQRFGPQLHVLDDGFQHRALQRDFDIVLVSERDVHDRLLPTGRLREPLTALERASVLVVEEGKPLPVLPAKGTAIWQVRRGLRVPETARRVIAFCGVARPERFFQELRAAGVVAASEISFADHHSYTRTNVDDLLRLKKDKNCSGFITTEKDVINLGAAQAAELQPLSVTRVTMELVDADKAMATFWKSIAAKLAATGTQGSRSRP